MSDLDSRALRQTNCFGQRFTTLGIAKYQINSLGRAWTLPTGQSELSIEVLAVQSTDMTGQHHVMVSFSGGQFTADPADVRVGVGSMVTWAAANPSVPPFTVTGAGPGGRFGSAQLSDQSIFTHAFAAAGEFEWVDSGGSGLGGQISVKPVDASTSDKYDAWMKLLKQPTLVHIKDGQILTNRQVSVVVGQTVCWAIEGPQQISITDKRLVPVGRVPVGPGPVVAGPVVPGPVLAGPAVGADQAPPPAAVAPPAGRRWWAPQG